MAARVVICSMSYLEDVKRSVQRLILEAADGVPPGQSPKLHSRLKKSEFTDSGTLLCAPSQEAGLLAGFLRQLEAAGGVPPGQLAAHVPGLVLEAHHLAAL